MADQVLVQGSGGAIWVLDVPESGLALERYNEQRAKGDITVLPTTVPPEGSRERAKLDDLLASRKFTFEPVPLVAVEEPPAVPPAGPSEPAAPGDDAPPGNGSRPAWAEYAGKLGVAVEDAMTRDDIKAAVEAHLAAS